MPYKRKDSPIWWVSYTDAGGKRVRRPTGTSDKKEADALEAKWKLEVFRQQRWEEQPTRQFEDVILYFLKTRADKRSAKDDKSRARTLRDFFARKDMRFLSRKDVIQYISSRNPHVSNGTINRELSLLSAAINLCNNDLEWSLPNPVKGSSLREKEGRVRWITHREAQALIKEAGRDSRARHLPAFIVIALNTGMRCNEILKLDWKRVDLENGLIYLEGIHTKAGRRRTVPINQQARNAFMQQLKFRETDCPSCPWVFCKENGDRVTVVRNGFSSSCKRAGISDFRIHDLRHTCAAWMVQAGVPLVRVRDLLGHSSITTTEIYSHLAPKDVIDAVSVLDRCHDLVTLDSINA